MPLDHWLAFVAASVIMLAIPGPTVLLVVSYALGHGRKPALAIATGVALGDLTAMTASMLGLGAVLMTSAAIFTVLRWIGGAYLIYLGVRLWRAPVGPAEMLAVKDRGWRPMMAHAYAVTASNPKSIIFFVAFVPQFMDTTQPVPPQAGILVPTFVVLAALNAWLYAWLAAAARGFLRSAPAQRAVNCTGGSLLIGAGLLAFAWRRAPG